MIDANQRWDVQEAIDRVGELAEFNLLWIEEPTSPDDVLGHAAIARAVAPIGVATGEHCANRVLFKQLLQAKAISFCQIDSCRLGGVNENLAVILMAAKFGVPVCPHAGGVGLCELVQHLSMFDYIAVSGNARESRHRVRRSSPRAFRRSRGDQERALHATARAGLLGGDQSGVAQAVSLPNGRGMDGQLSTKGTKDTKGTKERRTEDNRCVPFMFA